MDNPEPVFTARAVRLMAPPQLVKDKHVRLRVAPAINGAVSAATAVSDFTPRCHPAAAAIPKRRIEATLTTEAPEPRTPSWRNNIPFKAMGWGLKESCDALRLLAGDRLDIAYSVSMNDHPEFGGLELTLRDLARAKSGS
jgi:hypothetical protein